MFGGENVRTPRAIVSGVAVLDVSSSSKADTLNI